MSKHKDTRHYPALDGLRGVAALAVVAYHVALYFQLAYVPAHAYLAVDFFFMLSGYVIAYAYDHRLARDMDAWRFMLVRLIRLYPLALIGVCLGTAALLLRSRLDPNVHVQAVLEAAAANLVLLPATALRNIRPWAFPTDSPLWSLAFEIWINLIYALLFRVMTRAVLAAILVIGGLLLLWAALAHGSLNIGFYFPALYLGWVRVTFPFVAGVLLRRILSARNQHFSKGSAANLAFLLLIFILFGPSFSGFTLNNGAYDAAAVLIVFPVIVFLGTLTPPAFRLDRIWAAFGNISYPVYVLHFPIVAVASNLVHQRHWHGAMLYSAAFGTFCATIAFAAAALKLYDVPVRRFLTQRLIASGARFADRKNLASPR